jgi:hypothetical protein
MTMRAIVYTFKSWTTGTKNVNLLTYFMPHSFDTWTLGYQSLLIVWLLFNAKSAISVISWWDDNHVHFVQDQYDEMIIMSTLYKTNMMRW